MLFEEQEHQEKCVNNIVKVLEKSNFNHSDSSQEMKISASNKFIEPQYPKTEKNKLDVIMETGTGKTFTYLKTILELHKQFGKTKFIIILPRSAIKLGVIQNIKLTKEYFFEEYKKHLNYIDYPKDGLDKINRDFIDSNELVILLTNNSAFNSHDNKINKKTETLFTSGSTWDGIVSQKPVVIIDEPHLLKGQKTTKYLEKLRDAKSLFLRFGATYPNEEEHEISNVIYSLDSISSFNKRLVKQINVNTVSADSEINSNFKIFDVKPNKSFKASFKINKQMHEKIVCLEDDLGEKTSLDEYLGTSVVRIKKDKIYLSNNRIIDASLNNYKLSDTEIKTMIEETIKIHFEKEQRLFNQGVKTLSLFFIPSIKDFRGENPKIKKIFEQVYKKIRKEVYENIKDVNYKEYLKRDFNENGKLIVHEGYFSGDKKSKDAEEADGVEIILNDKERLLSFDKPLRFIFSVWALQEGWDNPNIFNICKLASSNKETSKRQQVGRGLRIAVNQRGKRLTEDYLCKNNRNFKEINKLDVIVPSEEENFVREIQEEINKASASIVGETIKIKMLIDKGLEDFEAMKVWNKLSQNKIIDEKGVILSPISDFLLKNEDGLKSDFTSDRFKDIKKIFQENDDYIVDKSRDRKLVKIKLDQWSKFKELWEVINKKSEMYYKDIDEDEIIKNIVKRFDEVSIDKVSIKIKRSKFNSEKNRVEEAEEILGNVDYFKQRPLQTFIMNLTTDMEQPLRFMLKLFNSLDTDKIRNNPDRARSILKDIIEDSIHKTILNKISYKFKTTVYSNELQDVCKDFKKEIIHTFLGRYHIGDETPPDEFLYDTIIYDSNIEKNAITKDSMRINKNNVVTVFAKLPKINIPTPYKTYNPDFAYLIETNNDKNDKLFLVIETKGYDSEDQIPHNEKQKINYAKKFFKSLQKELPNNIKIRYEERLNKTELGDIVTKVLGQGATSS